MPPRRREAIPFRTLSDVSSHNLKFHCHAVVVDAKLPVPQPDMAGRDQWRVRPVAQPARGTAAADALGCNVHAAHD